METTMRAVRHDRFGPPEVLEIERITVPRPGPGQVLVRVHAASVSGGETAIREGRLRRVMRSKPPRGIGVDFSGRVVGVGTGVSPEQVGREVWGLMPHMAFGSTAEYVAVPVGRVAPAPRGLDPIRAAALPATGTTVLTALVEKARLAEGERLLVRGASGGVGSAAVEVGRALGAHVTGLAGARNLDWVRELGAHEALDHRRTGPEDLGRFDVVLDVVGTRLESYRRLLGPGGRMLPLAMDTSRPLRSAAYVLWSAVAHRRQVLPFSNDPSPETLAELTRYVESGRLTPHVDEVFPMSRIRDAHHRMERGGVRGKLVVSMAEDAATG
ncbi:NAD(P)-dependent alcohol dehydrogenase [Nocardiopsis ganjiahuensis]|uniref:NAD(P)-dependent alcohol dehydrogenase n=1 Tax=Nocardiopsis ganjiahuensis TaxID=239984 RepID=UPI0003469B24|nr:NAD(P)-dependent alcohol dehydrogenase [Nocardiopsis ganjiahuensis]